MMSYPGISELYVTTCDSQVVIEYGNKCFLSVYTRVHIQCNRRNARTVLYKQTLLLLNENMQNGAENDTKLLISRKPIAHLFRQKLAEYFMCFHFGFSFTKYAAEQL